VPWFGAQVITCSQRTKRFDIEALDSVSEARTRDGGRAGQESWSRLHYSLSRRDLSSSAPAGPGELFNDYVLGDPELRRFGMYYWLFTSRETGICAYLAVFVRLGLINGLVGR
jgi:hypothetical protein